MELQRTSKQNDPSKCALFSEAPPVFDLGPGFERPSLRAKKKTTALQKQKMRAQIACQTSQKTGTPVV